MNIPAKDVFNKVLVDAIKNIVFYGLGALAITFIGNALSLRLLGIILGVFFTFVMLLSLIPFLFSVIAGLVTTPMAMIEAVKGNKKAAGEEIYLWAGTIVQLVENTICFLYVLYLYRSFF